MPNHVQNYVYGWCETRTEIRPYTNGNSKLSAANTGRWLCLSVAFLLKLNEWLGKIEELTFGSFPHYFNGSNFFEKKTIKK